VVSQGGEVSDGHLPRGEGVHDPVRAKEGDRPGCARILGEEEDAHRRPFRGPGGHGIPPEGDEGGERLRGEEGRGPVPLLGVDEKAEERIELLRASERSGGEQDNGEETQEAGHNSAL